MLVACQVCGVIQNSTMPPASLLAMVSEMPSMQMLPLSMVAAEFLRQAHTHAVVLPDGLDGGDLARGIDVPHDEVPAEASAAAHGALEVADAADLQLPQRGDAQGLCEQVELDGVIRPDAVDGEAAAVDRNRIAQRQLVGEGDVNGVARPLADGGDGADNT